jgi:hypothetical protein
MFIKAAMHSAEGVELEGYIVWSNDVYAIGIFSTNREYVFNRRIALSFEMNEPDLCASLGIAVGSLFPIDFKTPFFLPSGDVLEGRFFGYSHKDGNV